MRVGAVRVGKPSYRSTVFSVLGVIALTAVLLATIATSGHVQAESGQARSTPRVPGVPSCFAHVFRARHFLVPNKSANCQQYWKITSGDLTVTPPENLAESVACDYYVDRDALRHELCAYNSDGSLYVRFDFRTVAQACVPRRGPIPASLLTRPVPVADCDLTGKRVVQGPYTATVSRGDPEHPGPGYPVSASHDGRVMVVVRDTFAVYVTFERAS